MENPETNNTIELKWYRYNQNNSGGTYLGPALEIYVQASNDEEADDMAEEHGVYFNGCQSGMDCSCCGDRWYPNDGPEDDFDVESLNDSRECYGSGRSDYDAIAVYYDGKKRHFPEPPQLELSEELKAIL